MRLKGVLLVTRDIGRSRKFYEDVFGLKLLGDNDGNMVLSEGVFLQDEGI